MNIIKSIPNHLSILLNLYIYLIASFFTIGILTHTLVRQMSYPSAIESQTNETKPVTSIIMVKEVYREIAIKEMAILDNSET